MTFEELLEKYQAVLLENGTLKDGINLLSYYWPFLKAFT